MGERKQDGSKQMDSVVPPDPGDIADAAERQMPGRPPLAFDPSKRAGEHVRAEEEKLSGKFKK